MLGNDGGETADTRPDARPRVFISYAHEDDGGAHAGRVFELYRLLREEGGVDAQLDVLAAQEPQDWTLWMQRQFVTADFVLVIASPAYKRRAEGTETPGVGKGVTWEAGFLRQYVYGESAGWFRRVLKVVLPGGSPGDLPAYLGGDTVSHFTVDPITVEGAEDLIRYLWKEPALREPRLGPRPRFPTREHAGGAGDTGPGDALPPELAEVWRSSQASAGEAETVGLHPSGRELLLSEGLYIERGIEKDVVAALESPGCTAVVGEAGFGKTSLVWSVHRRFAERGHRPLFIRASSLLSGLYEPPRDGATRRRTGVLVPDVVLRALEQAARREPTTVLLIDTVDLLMHSDDACALVVEVLQSADRLDLPTLLTCRPVEAHRLASAAERAGVEIRTKALAAYDGAEWPKAVRSYAHGYYDGVDGAPPADLVVDRVVNAASLGRALREVCANPFALRLLFELYAPAVPDEDVDTPGLYDRFWKRRVVSDQRAWRTDGTALPAVDLSPYARAAARLMLSSSRIDAQRAVLESRIEYQLARTRTPVLPDGPEVGAALEALRSRGVLTIRDQTGYLWFFHQTFFEHAAARGVLACGSAAVDDLMTRVAQDPGDLYFGEVASEVLLMAGRLPEASGDTYSPDRADATLAGWLAARDPALLGMGLRVYAKLKIPGPLVLSSAADALERADTPTIDRFLRLLPSVTHEELDRPLRDLARLWATRRKDGKRVRKGVIEALVRLATQDVGAVEAFTRRHGCFEWLKSWPPNELHHHERLAFRLLDALVTADQERAVGLALDFWRAAARTGQLSLQTDLVVRMADWHLPPRLVRKAVKEFLRGLAGIRPGKQDTVPFERAFSRFFLRSAPRADSVLPHLRAVLGTAGDPSPAAAERQGHASPLVLRTTLRMHTAAVMNGLCVDAAAFLDTVLATRDPQRQLAVCYGVLTEALVGRAARFETDPRGTGPTPPDTENPLTVEARRRCAQALRALPCEENSPLGGKDPRWLWRNALQEAALPPDALLHLLPPAGDLPADPARSLWLRNTGLSSFLISGSLAGHTEARLALDALAGDREVQRALEGTKAGRAALENMVGRLQYAVPRHLPLLDHLITYALTAAQPEVLHQTLGELVKNARTEGGPAPTARPPVPEAHRQTLTGHRRTLIGDRKPHLRRHGFILWKVLLELGVDDFPTVDEIVAAWQDAAAQDLRNAILELAAVTVPARVWDDTAPTRLLRLLRPLLKTGGQARQEPPARATEQVISHESNARMLLAQAHAHLGSLDRAEAHVAFVLCLAERAGYDVATQLGSHTLSGILRPLGFLMERLVAEDPSGAARLTATVVEAMHRIQPADVKWKRDIARVWAVFLGELCTRLAPADQERLVRRMLNEPAYCAPVVSAAAQLRPKPRWLDDLFRDEATPASLRESMRGSNYLHGRAEGRTGGWRGLLEYAPLY
ncbi:hypothetical protein [Streptomyces bullii]|uniref:SEFIR domain-containing protein n=1 Tax=Streptomyces bullii TaxID=349910 RepID=A0ABW0ULV1_9ACTN